MPRRVNKIYMHLYPAYEKLLEENQVFFLSYKSKITSFAEETKVIFS